MSNGRRLVSVVLVTAFLMGLVVSTGTAQVVRFGFIDSEKIFSEYKAWIKAQEEFNTQYQAWDEEAREMQKELEDMIEEYEKQKLILSDEKKREREAGIETKRQALDAFTQKIFGPNGTAEQKNNELVQPLIKKINAAIERLATEENYDFIFNSEGLAYAKKDYDVTDKVLEFLEEE